MCTWHGDLCTLNEKVKVILSNKYLVYLEGKVEISPLTSLSYSHCFTLYALTFQLDILDATDDAKVTNVARDIITRPQHTKTE